MLTKELREEAISMFRQYELPYLKDLHSLLGKEIETRQLQSVQDGIVSINKIASSLGMTVDELMQLQPRARRVEPAKDKPKKAKKAKAEKVLEARAPNPPRYRHPSEDLTWTGKGPAPKWLKELLTKGKTIEHFAIKPN